MKKEDVLEEIEEDEKWYRGPIKIILSVFLILLIILMVFPRYAVKLDPEPKRIISMTELGVDDLVVSDKTYSITELNKIIDAGDVQIKNIANKIVSSGCESGRVCQAKALYYFVRDNVKYVSDPIGKEYIEDPKAVLKSGGGDCESGSILLANLMESIGINSELVMILGHAYIRVLLPDAINKYKTEDDWVYLDWTCEYCEFGEIPWQNLKKEARYVDV